MPADPQTAAVERFDVAGFRGELASAYRPVDVEATLRRLVDPASARQTLHWGRNYLYSAELESASGPVAVVVKQFRNQGIAAGWRRRRAGSKALRSWRAAWALGAAGVSTPEPAMLIESSDPAGPSFLVTRRLEGFLEARYFCRALNAGTVGEVYPDLDPVVVLEQIGSTLRRLHAAGVWHRDISVGNVLLLPGADAQRPEIHLIDLNRARLGCRLGVLRRTRDLCRLRIFDRAHQEILLRAYWGGQVPAWKRWLYRFDQQAFLFKMGAKGLLRWPFRRIAGGLQPRRAHAHIPPAPPVASKRDRVAWDHLSDQPHQHAGRLQRLAVRLSDAREHGRELRAFAGAMPRIWRSYRRLERQLYRKPVPWQGLGIAVRPWAEKPEALLTALEELGVRRVLLRLHPWQEEHGEEMALARELHQSGYDIAFALPQNRELVRDPARWRAAIRQIAESFRPYGRHFQVGQAINRSKWGVWNHREYLALVREACEVLREDSRVEILGPAVIDYEFHRLAGVLNVPQAGVHFDVVSSLLYVDRRGAPENRQLGFDTVHKVLQLKAVAETARNASGRCWITEVNWPLSEGPHSPAGRRVAVDEECQADYLVRYFLLTLGTGLVERVYWWQLVARGYGLSCPGEAGELRLRPSFRALKTLRSQLEGLDFVGPLPAGEPGRLRLFATAEGEEVVVGWSTGAPTRASLPRPPREVVTRDGASLPAPRSREVELGSAPLYFRLSTPR